MNNAKDANNSHANLGVGAGRIGGLLPLHYRKMEGGREGVKSKKQFLGRKEVRLALGHQCVHGQVCSGRKVVTPTIVRKWDCRRGPPGAS